MLHIFSCMYDVMYNKEKPLLVIVVPSLLNDRLTGYRILGSQVFFVSTLKIFVLIIICCLSAPNPSFFAILCDNRPKLCRLHFFLARSLGVRFCQERAPEGHYKDERERRKGHFRFFSFSFWFLICSLLSQKNRTPEGQFLWHHISGHHIPMVTMPFPPRSEFLFAGSPPLRFYVPFLFTFLSSLKVIVSCCSFHLSTP